jgi:Actin like proteins N terminal domain
MTKKLIIAIDLGASLTKCFYGWLIDGLLMMAGYKTFCSAVQLISATQYEQRQYASDSTSLVSFDDEYWGVGENARQAVTNTNLQGLKFRDAIAKALALVGQVVRESVVLDSTAELHIELGILLPLNEMGNEDELKARIVRLLYEGFGHNGNRIKFKFVNRVHVAPEGDGIRQIAKRFPAVFLMFGHKDFTLGCIQEKEISLVDSRPLPGWGMLKLVRQIPYTFVDELRAAAAIYAAGEKLQDKHLLKVVLPEDLARVKAAIPEIRQLIWAQLWKELVDGPIQDAAQIFAAGGNAVFWYPELKRQKEIGPKLSMGGELINEIRERFPELDKSPQLYRLADCYGSYKVLESGSCVPSLQKELLGGGKK